MKKTKNKLKRGRGWPIKKETGVILYAKHQFWVCPLCSRPWSIMVQ